MITIIMITIIIIIIITITISITITANVTGTTTGSDPAALWPAGGHRLHPVRIARIRLPRFVPKGRVAQKPFFDR